MKSATFRRKIGSPSAGERGLLRGSTREKDSKVYSSTHPSTHASGNLTTATEPLCVPYHHHEVSWVGRAAE